MKKYPLKIKAEATKSKMTKNPPIISFNVIGPSFLVNGIVSHDFAGFRNFAFNHANRGKKELLFPLSTVLGKALANLTHFVIGEQRHLAHLQGLNIDPGQIFNLKGQINDRLQVG